MNRFPNFFSISVFILFIMLLCVPVQTLSADPTVSSPAVSSQAEQAQNSSISSRPAQVAALPPIDLTASILSMVKGLAICIALLLFVVWVLKKIKSPIVTGQGRKLKIIERLPVSTKSSILLIEVNKKKILIGVGSDPVRLISDFVESDAIDVALEETKIGDKNE